MSFANQMPSHNLGIIYSIQKCPSFSINNISITQNFYFEFRQVKHLKSQPAIRIENSTQNI